MPLAEDIMVYLRGLGFVPMGFEELHHWRRSTRVKHPRQSQGPVRFSRGQIMHGDMLFFRDSSLFLDDVEANLRLAFIAIAYGYLDHARDLMQRPAVRKWLLQHEISNLDGALGKVSCQHRRLFRRAKRKQSFEELLFGIRQLFS